MRVVTVVGGHGATGSTAALARLTTAAATRHHRVIALDADLRFGNLDRFFGVAPACGLAHVLRGRCSLAQAMRPTAWPGLRLIPSGVHDRPIRRMTTAQRLLVLEGIDGLRADCDLLVIDAGVSTDLFFFAGIADRLVLVMTADRDSCRPSAALITALAARLPKIAIDVLVIGTESGADGLAAFAMLAGLCPATIAADLHYLGEIRFGRRVSTTGSAACRAEAFTGPETDEVAERMAVQLLGSRAVPRYGLGAFLQ